MKTIFTILLTLLCSATVFSQTNTENPDKYCAKLKDGIVAVMHQGNPITTEVILNNGAKIQPNGMVTKPDGTSFVLNEGDCVDKEGNMGVEKKTKNEKPKKK